MNMVHVAIMEIICMPLVLYSGMTTARAVRMGMIFMSEVVIHALLLSVPSVRVP